MSAFPDGTVPLNSTGQYSNHVFNKYFAYSLIPAYKQVLLPHAQLIIIIKTMATYLTTTLLLATQVKNIFNNFIMRQTRILIYISDFQHSNNVFSAPNTDHTSPEWRQMDVEQNTQINNDHDMSDSDPAFDSNNAPENFDNDDPASPINFLLSDAPVTVLDSLTVDNSYAPGEPPDLIMQYQHQNHHPTGTHFSTRYTAGEEESDHGTQHNGSDGDMSHDNISSALSASSESPRTHSQSCPATKET
ncbi:hypothetical protein M422DRAFT_56743 [Sphaerobolus stellatus SS14]|uniref:Uncharacterized protein n=1 Tax=Sphaerobolus stellatus (strain SS14) TaxID=990650 RepID=A0A0C9T480_SPHS4|nr:hypothetical protein M422DRAFT_56743 [Sphaerobolus stellatus SS14]